MLKPGGRFAVATSVLIEPLEEGKWPSEDEWGLSDHGVLSTTFAFADEEGEDDEGDGEDEDGERGEGGAVGPPDAR